MLTTGEPTHFFLCCWEHLCRGRWDCRWWMLRCFSKVYSALLVTIEAEAYAFYRHRSGWFSDNPSRTQFAFLTLLVSSSRATARKVCPMSFPTWRRSMCVHFQVTSAIFSGMQRVHHINKCNHHGFPCSSLPTSSPLATARAPSILHKL